ncbi:ubiquitin-like protein 4A [Misgurnus anguillicaudatus]|uniref:ubiquitin-like protein 4A n=1 Tax=Misgurnus anguillicaudatus TaxID=75329 RepID=UPI003CCF4574
MRRSEPLTSCPWEKSVGSAVSECLSTKLVSFYFKYINVKMILTVKPLQGKECNVQVTENEKVSTVKELVSERLNIPPSQQRLLYKGKALADEHRLSDYSIGPEAKLNLVVRPAGERSAGAMGTSSSVHNDKTGSGVWQLLSTVLAKHFSPADAAKVQEQLIKDYERSLRQLSLDDIERLASHLLHPETEGMDTSYMD